MTQTSFAKHLDIDTFPVGPLQCNCSIVADTQTGDAIIVDPGDDAHEIIQKVESKGYHVKYLLQTHAHIDHVAATDSVQKACGGEVCLHKGDLPLYENLALQAQFLRYNQVPPAAHVTQYLQGAETVEASKNLRMDVLFTPGHTPGSLCFYMPEFGEAQTPLLFSGDTLFNRSIGRTDLWGGDSQQIQESLKTKLMTLPDQTVVICGHGRQTTIEFEKLNNPFLKDLI